MEKRRLTLLLTAGAIGPVLFWLVVIVDGFTKSGYDARKDFVSELAVGERGWVQSANFVVVGLLMLAFAVGLRELFPTGRASLFGPILVTRRTGSRSRRRGILRPTSTDDLNVRVQPAFDRFRSRRCR